jgi:hypothetical protein
VNLFSKIFNVGNIQPSKQVRQSLLLRFPKARSVEWTNQTDYWEAVFYENKIEKIAKFSNDGALVEYRVNQTGNEMPDSVIKALGDQFEIMNCIGIHTSDSVQYELIVRDKTLTRFLFIFHQTGKIVRQEKL